MLVFVTGATGALGRPTVQLLLAHGHRVRALAHDAGAVAKIRALGAEPVPGSLFDPAGLAEAVAGADAVLHLATRIPPLRKSWRRGAWATTDRIRTEGTRNLVDAALAASSRVFVYPSVTFIYDDAGDTWITEEAPVTSPGFIASTLDAEREVRRFRAQSEERRGVVLRMAGLYGVSAATMREMAGFARMGVNAHAGPAAAYGSFVWDGDAATALVAALHAPSGIYNIADDHPLTRSEFGQILGEAVGRRRLLRLPAGLIRRISPHLEVMMRSQRVANTRFKEVTGWAPSVPTLRDGLGRLGLGGKPAAGSSRLGGGVTLALWAFAAYTLLAGLWQTLLPASFYETFPGFGMHWVDVDGPYNEHLLRDTGAGNLAIGAVLLFAAVTRSVGAARAAALGLVVASLPHTLYHLLNVGKLPTLADQIAQTTAISGTTVAAVALLAAVLRPVRRRPQHGHELRRRDASEAPAGYEASRDTAQRRNAAV